LLVATHRGQYNAHVLQANSHETTLSSARCKNKRRTYISALPAITFPSSMAENPHYLSAPTEASERHFLLPLLMTRSFKRPYSSVQILPVSLHLAALNRMHSSLSETPSHNTGATTAPPLTPTTEGKVYRGGLSVSCSIPWRPRDLSNTQFNH
jgi:hypothetical protein